MYEESGVPLPELRRELNDNVYRIWHRLPERVIYSRYLRLNGERVRVVRLEHDPTHGLVGLVNDRTGKTRRPVSEELTVELNRRASESQPYNVDLVTRMVLLPKIEKEKRIKP